ncbi:MAG TPA: redoxin domain-containing protein [Pyrinomonadaceae bacterium]|jgi:thiol-disulfide isomerase/thioredoxin
MSRRSLSAFSILLVVVAGALAPTPFGSRARSAQGETKNRPPSVELKVNAPAANDLTTVQELDEAGLARLLQREGVSSQQNARPLLVNFWATWCDPCREEFPDLVKIDKDYRSRGLDFVTISLDDVSEINNQVPRFILKMGASAIPAYLLNVKDAETAISAVDKQWRGELPATFLFNRQGQIVFRHMGRIKPKELRKALDETMNAER